MKVQPKFDYQNFARIDELLSAIHYRGISLTGVPGNFLKDTFITTPYDLTLKKLIVSFLSRVRLRYFQNFNFRLNTQVPQNIPYLFSFCDLSPRLIDFAIPVINKIGADKCFATAPSYKASGYMKQIGYHAFPCITSEVYKKWKIEYACIASQVKKTIYQIRKERNISLTAAIDLETNTMYQTLLFENALDFLSRTKPKAIICDSDRQPTNCALVMAGNKLDIPTFTFIHGSIDPADNYIPVLTKYIFCWGNDHVQMLGQVNTPASKMIVTGNTKLSRNLKADASTVKQKLGIPTDSKKTIVLFTNNIEPVLQENLAKSFIRFCEGNKEVRGILKLHPLESKQDYSNIQFLHSMNVYSSDEVSFDEILTIADGVLTHNSLIAVDTLIKQKPLAILDTIELPLGIASRLHRDADVPLVTDQYSFDRFVQMVSDNQYPFNSKELFIKNYCEAFDSEAVSRTVDAINQASTLS